MANTPNLALWDVTESQYESDTMCVAGGNMYTIAGTFQPVGAAIDPGIYYYQIQAPRTSNPLTVTFWQGGMRMVTGTADGYPSFDTIRDLFADTYVLSHTSTLLGYAMGNGNNADTWGRVVTQSASTNNTNFVNNTFGSIENNVRWYPEQVKSEIPNNYYTNFSARLRVDKRKICGVIFVDCCKKIPDLSFLGDSSTYADYTTLHTFTLKEWESGQNTLYPCIIKAYIKWYIGDINNRAEPNTSQQLRFFSDYNLLCEDVCAAYTYMGGLYTREKFPKLNADIIPRGYLTQSTIYEGVLIEHYAGSSGNTVSNFLGLTKGIFKHSSVVRACYRYQQGLVYFWKPVLISYFVGSADELRQAAYKIRLPIADTVPKAQTGDIETDPEIKVPTSNPDGSFKGVTDDPDEKADELDTDKPADFDPSEIDPEYDVTPEEDPDNPEYDPKDDPENETKKIELNKPVLGTVGVFNRCYACTADELQRLSDYLWNVDETTFETILKGLQLAGSDPLNAIISIFMYPFAVTTTGSLENIRIGVVDTEISAISIDHSSVIVYELGECYFWDKYKNYLDYEPYTTAQLYIPYVGVIQIPVKQFMRKWINVKLVVDILTGVGQVVIYARTADTLIPIIYRDCTIGIQIAVTGQSASQIAGNYINAITRIGAGSVGAAKGAAAGSVGGVLSAAGGIAAGCYDLYTAENVPIESSGSSSPQCSMYMPQRCYLIVNRPQPIQLNHYGKLVGFACWESGIIRNFPGFSKFSNVILNITVATDSEKKEILKQLSDGVYI